MDNMNDGLIDSTKRFTVICFEITNNCNKNCVNCSRMYSRDKRIENMRIDDYKYIISCINEKDRNNFRKIIITGGEPILHPQFKVLITSMRKDFPKAELNIQTNGRLIDRYLGVLYNIKNFKLSVSYYPGWNENIKKEFGTIKLPSFYRRFIRKVFKNNKFVKRMDLDYRIPYLKRLRRFLKNPFNIKKIYFKCFSGFWDPYNNPNLSEIKAKVVRKICCYYIWIIGRNLYNCCDSAVYERFYNTESVHIKFDKNWKKNFFKLQTWKACIHCRLGADRYKFIEMETKLGYEKYELINLKTRLKATRIKDHD